MNCHISLSLFRANLALGRNKRAAALSILPFQAISSVRASSYPWVRQPFLYKSPRYETAVEPHVRVMSITALHKRLPLERYTCINNMHEAGIAIPSLTVLRNLRGACLAGHEKLTDKTLKIKFNTRISGRHAYSNSEHSTYKC